MGTPSVIETNTIIPVTGRIAQDTLYQELLENRDAWSDAGVKSVTAIGDCFAPATIAMAVHAGHEYARNRDKSEQEITFFRRELGLGGE